MHSKEQREGATRNIEREREREREKINGKERKQENKK